MVFYCIVWHCIVFNGIVLHCMVLYCIHCIWWYWMALYSIHGISWCCTVLHSILLYCIVFKCIALYWIVLHSILLCCSVFECITWYCMVLHDISLYCMVLHHILLYSISLHGIALYYMVLYSLYCTAANDNGVHLFIFYWNLNLCHYGFDPLTLANVLWNAGLIVGFSQQITPRAGESKEQHYRGPRESQVGQRILSPATKNTSFNKGCNECQKSQVKHLNKGRPFVASRWFKTTLFWAEKGHLIECYPTSMHYGQLIAQILTTFGTTVDNGQ